MADRCRQTRTNQGRRLHLDITACRTVQQRFEIVRLTVRAERLNVFVAVFPRAAPSTFSYFQLGKYQAAENVLQEHLLLGQILR